MCVACIKSYFSNRRSFVAVFSFSSFGCSRFSGYWNWKAINSNEPKAKETNEVRINFYSSLRFSFALQIRSILFRIFRFLLWQHFTSTRCSGIVDFLFLLFVILSIFDRHFVVSFYHTFQCQILFFALLRQRKKKIASEKKRDKNLRSRFCARLNEIPSNEHLFRYANSKTMARKFFLINRFVHRHKHHLPSDEYI